MFTGPVTDVSSTRIFARLDGERQFLVYAMAYAAEVEIAMVLPLPVQSGRGEDAVTFISLEGYTDFFADLAEAFKPESDIPSFGAMSHQASLAVHQVGAFEASYIPTIADFDRLDRRFRLPDHLWEHLPGYRDWGFVVFQLRAPMDDERPRRRRWRGHDAREVHPMAFSFPTRRTNALYFPTVHVHDGTWHEEAEFNHTLYCQFTARPAGWYPSNRPLGEYVRSDDSKGIIAGEKMGYECALYGLLPNQDVWVTDDDPPRGSPLAWQRRRDEEERRRREEKERRRREAEERWRRAAEERRMREEEERRMREERARRQKKLQSAHERAMLERYGLSEQPCNMKCGRQALKGKPSCEAHTPIDTDIRLANM